MAENPEDQVEVEVEAPAPYTGPVLTASEGDTKADIRSKVWEHLESNNLATFPRPVKNRIPNYKGSAAACDRITGLEAFTSAQTIKINPDKPQEQARFRTLENEKTLLVPTPRLRKGLFNKIQPQDTRKSTYKFCSTSQGVKQYSSPLGLDMKVKVDLVIIGSVAVSEDGWRIGKGEGFADLEYGMMAAVEAVNERTIVVTAVHDCQVMELPDQIFGPHDVTIDYICTPTRVIECSPRPKPKGIIWSLLSLEKFSHIPILKVLREKERDEGKDVTLQDATEEEIEEALARIAQQEEEEPADREGGEPRRRNRRNRGRGRRGDGGPDREAHRDMNGAGSGAEGGENADGEDSPSGDKRRYNNNYRRRRFRNRRRTRDSERLNSEGEPVSADDRQESTQGNYDDGPPRRRRPRRVRKRTNEGHSGAENDDGGGGQDIEDRGKRGEPSNRRPRRYRNRQRRSESDRNEQSDGQQNKENQPYDPRAARRRPRRFGYQNRRPRNDEGRRRDEAGDYSDSGNPDREGGSPSSERRRRERPRRNNNLPTIYVGSLPKALRVSAFKKQVRDMDVNPLRVLWRGSNGHVFLIFETMEETESALQKLENLSVNDKEVRVAMANRTERRKRGDQGSPGQSGDGEGLDSNPIRDLSNQVNKMSIDNRAADQHLQNAVTSEL